jgi:circadian clock protein KaiB
MGTRSKKPIALQLRLYIAGNAPNSLRAIDNLNALCELHRLATAEIVDVLEFPLRGLADGIVVTPTLVKLLPLPVKRVIGNLSDTKQVMMSLESK